MFCNVACDLVCIPILPTCGVRKLDANLGPMVIIGCEGGKILVKMCVSYARFVSVVWSTQPDKLLYAKWVVVAPLVKLSSGLVGVDWEGVALLVLWSL